MPGLFAPTVWVREIHIIGLGGIGSWLATFLMQHGIQRIHLYDDDVVEEHNLGAQCYRRSDVARRLYKVDALIDYAKRQEFTTTLIPHIMRVSANTPVKDVPFSGVVISGVDSMKSRTDIWRFVKRNGLVELYMDGRIGGETFQLYTLNPSSPKQLKKYEAWMYSDEEATDDPCAVRYDFDSALVLGGFITHNLTSFARGESPAEILHGNLSAVAINGRQASVVRSL